MSHIVLDAQTLKKLDPLKGSLEVRDEAGKVVGWFTPLVDPSQYQGLPGPQISPEEIERRRKESGGRTLAEIMADLEKKA